MEAIAERAVLARLQAQADAAPSVADADVLGRLVAEQLLGAGAPELVDLTASKPKPLAGRTVLVPARSPAGTVEALAAAGAEVVQAEFTRREPLPVTELAAVFAEGWDWLVV
ncbi:MAG: hypothetical protein DI570_27015, partial [Phenylobacterium zucineum]